MVGVINEHDVSTIPNGVEGRCRCKKEERFGENNQSKIDAFEIIATYMKMLQKIQNYLLQCY